MYPRLKFSITLCAMFCISLLFAATVAAQVQKTIETVKGNATVSVAQLKGTVVQVEGNGLLSKAFDRRIQDIQGAGDKKVLHRRQAAICARPAAGHDAHRHGEDDRHARDRSDKVGVERQGVVHRGTHRDPDAGERSEQTVLCERYRQHPVHGRGSPGDCF